MGVDRGDRFTAVTLGSILELIVSVDMMQRGFSIYRSMSNNAPFDLVAVYEEKMFRVEVKSESSASNAKKDLHDILALVSPDRSVRYRPDLDKELKVLSSWNPGAGRPSKITTEQVKDLIEKEKLSVNQIAARLRVGVPTVMSRLKELGLAAITGAGERRGRRGRVDIKDDVLFDLYVNKKMSLRDIGIQLKVSAGLVRSRLVRYGLDVTMLRSDGLDDDLVAPGVNGTLDFSD